MSLLHDVLRDAVSVKASDVHLVVNYKPLLRQFGELVEVDSAATLTLEDLDTIIESLIPKHLREAFLRECEVDFSHQEPDVGRFRVNAFMEQGRPSVALRYVRTDIPTLAELGLPPILGELALSMSGIVLACGPSGSGKSTTLARQIQYINENAHRRVITIEDPIEFIFTNRQSIILQREIGIDTLSFSAALKNVLRQDPDVVMIGEMRDKESFSAALSMSETGHLVLSSLHADTAGQAISRILNFFPPEERDIIRLSLSLNLRGICCQRLLQDVNGRLVPAVEVLINTPTIRKLLEINALEKISAAIEGDPEGGMQTFSDAILRLIESGRITEEEGLANAPHPEALRMRLSGINLSEGRRILQ